MDERDLVCRAQAGDKEAFTQLVEKYNSLLRTLVSYYLGSHEVSDVSQEIWILIYQWQQPYSLDIFGQLEIRIRMRKISRNLTRNWAVTFVAALFFENIDYLTPSG